MSNNPWQQARLAAGVGLVVAGLLGVPAFASAYTFNFDSPWYCSNAAIRINGHMVMTPSCAAGTTVSLQTGVFADQTDAAWREWWNLDTTNAAVWVRRDICVSSSAHPGAEDGVSVALASSTAVPLGTTWTFADCSVGQIPIIEEIDIASWTGGVNSVTECAHGQATFNETWVHELGHAYGYDHFDDWSSTMNTSTPDVTSCTPNRLARPSSDAQQGHDALYGLVDAYDYGSTPMVQTGSIPSTGLTLPASLTTYPLGTSTNRSVMLDMTRMNMRDAWPNATVNYRVYLSSDHVLSGDDVFIADQSIGSGLFAGAIYRMTPTVTFIPSVVLAPGATKCFLIKWDAWGSAVSEVREDDNVMDTDICVKRNTT